VTQWVTSSALSLFQGATLPVNNGAFTQFLLPNTVNTFVGTAVMPSAPTLAITAQNGNVVLSWPASAIGFAAESSTDLGANVWIPVSPPPIVIGDQNVITNFVTDGPVFYRLKKL